MTGYLRFEALDVVSTLASAVIALIVAYFISWLWRPRVKVLGFELKGRSAPGLKRP
jgi:hypothetical protein